MIRFGKFRVIVYQLSRPLSYLRISHEDKWVYDWLIPGILTVITCFVSARWISLGELTSSDGLIAGLTGFVSNLPGFFIAALAAVATFNKNDIDKLMANPPKIEVLYQGNFLMVEMTRRRFLCVLFSYLTAVSIFLVIFSKIALSINLTTEYAVELSWVGVTVFFFVLWQMILATILGLYYLGERLHTPQ